MVKFNRNPASLLPVINIRFKIDASYSLFQVCSMTSMTGPYQLQDQPISELPRTAPRRPCHNRKSSRSLLSVILIKRTV